MSFSQWQYCLYQSNYYSTMTPQVLWWCYSLLGSVAYCWRTAPLGRVLPGRYATLTDIAIPFVVLLAVGQALFA